MIEYEKKKYLLNLNIVPKQFFVIDFVDLEVV